MSTIESYKSYFNSNLEINREIWATTLVCNSTSSCGGKPSSSGNNHAMIIVEGVKDSGEYFRKRVHLLGPASTDEKNPVAFRGSKCCMGMQRIGRVEIEDRTHRTTEHHTHKSQTWLRSAEKVQNLMRQAELERDKPSEFPRPFSILGNKSVLTSDLETFKITDPLVAAIADCNKEIFLKLYDRVKKCRDGVGIERLNERYFYPMNHLYRDDDGGYNIARHATWCVWDENRVHLPSLLEFFMLEDPPFCWRSRISGDRMCEIADLFKSTETSEDRERLIEEAPQQEKEFFVSVKKKFEDMLRWHQHGLTNTRTFLGWKGYGKRVNDLCAKIIFKYPELEERVTAFMHEFGESPISTCCQLLLTIFNSTDLCVLTPDSCFTWAREKLTLIDVEMPSMGIDSCVSLTKCYLTPIKRGCC